MFISPRQKTNHEVKINKIKETIHSRQSLRQWKGRKRIRKGRHQASQESSSWQHHGIHQARFSTTCSRWCKTYLWFKPWGDTRCCQSFPRERHPKAVTYTAQREEDRNGHVCSLCSKTTGQNPLRIRRLDCFASIQHKTALIRATNYSSKANSYVSLCHGKMLLNSMWTACL